MVRVSKRECHNRKWRYTQTPRERRWRAIDPATTVLGRPIVQPNYMKPLFQQCLIFTALNPAGSE